ncbi:unnamed protein product [Chrysoparadoxa australica]
MAGEENGAGKRTREEEDVAGAKKTKRRRSRFSDAPAIQPASVQVNGDLAQMAALQAQLDAQIQSAQSALGPIASLALSGAGAGPRKARDFSLMLDSQGRQVDAEGNVVKTQASAVASLKVNKQSMEQRKKNNPYLAHRKVGAEMDEDPADWVDGRLGPGRSWEAKGKKGLKFVEVGTFVKEGEVMRMREERRVQHGDGLGGRKNIEKVVEFASAKKEEKPAGELPKPHDWRAAIPVMEWWDEAFLEKGLRESKADGSLAPEKATTEALYAAAKLQHCRFYKYVQHPVATRGAGEKAQAEVAMPVFLTKRERKRIRRQARLEKQREKQDKIALGLMKPEEPKMKLSNFMKILGDQAIADPSKVEAMVAKQVRARELAHIARNQVRKLTPMEKREKVEGKLKRDQAKETKTALFRLTKGAMEDAKRRFKVDMNARQLGLTGGVIICPAANCELVVVEGGPGSIKKYIRLMLHRIKWVEEDFGEDQDSDDSDDEELGGHGGNDGLEGNSGMCELVWQGVVLRRVFTGFKFQECATAETARKLLAQKGVPHYWDQVANHTPGA